MTAGSVAGMPRFDTPRFDAVLFDAGGVLVLPDPTVLIPLLVTFGGSTEVDDHRRAHYAAMAAKSRAGSGERDWADYDVTYVTTVGVERDLAEHAADVLGLTRSHHLWRWPIPETAIATRALAERGVPMGVVSNAFGQVEAELRRAAICQTGPGDGTEMRVVIDSHVVGVAKPDPRIFGFALPHFAEFDPQRIAYVGDSVTMDVGASRAAGLHPLLLDPYDDHAGAEFERISSVDEVVGWC